MTQREGEAALESWTIGGTPVFTVSSDRTPWASLFFRAGLADERLATSGRLHLVEHLAMHSAEHPDVSCNASVGPLFTEFTASGLADDVVAFLQSVCAWLAEPDFDHLEHEIGILGAEYARRGTDDPAAHLGYRFGPRGTGLAAFRPLGLSAVTAEDLREEIERFFVAGNAVLATNFRSAPLTSLSLPGGDFRPAPRARHLAIPLPGLAAATTPFTAVSGLLANSAAAAAVGSVLSEVTAGLLRREMGASYGTTTALDRVDNETLVMCLSSDVAADHVRESVPLLHRALSEVAEHGVPREQFVRVHRDLLRRFDDALSGEWQAHASATALLRGAGTVTAHETRAQLQGLDESEVSAEIAGFVRSALFTSPSPDQSWAPFPRIEPNSPARKGEETVFKAWKPQSQARLSISPLTIVIEEPGTRVARSLEHAVALLKHPDGSRTVVADDAGTLHVRPADWLDGDVVVSQLDSYINDQDHIVTAVGDAHVKYEPPAQRRRLLRSLHETALDRTVQLACLLLLVPLVVLLVLTHRIVGAVAAIAWARFIFQWFFHHTGRHP